MKQNLKIVLLLILFMQACLFVQASEFGFSILPDTVIGEKSWGLATLSVSNMRAKPQHSSELVSQALMGTPLKVLDYSDGWFRVQTPEGYLGWMDSSGLARFTQEQMDVWKSSARYFYKQISGNVLAAPKKNSKTVSDLVLGDLLIAESESRRFLKIRIPDGRAGFVRKSDCISFQDWTSKQPDAESAISVAKNLLGSPYLWGGTSCKAVDCSGLTKIAYYSQGIILARDASQQAMYGTHPDFTQISNLQSGDLLFFGRDKQHIIHVGIYIGKGLYIHASGLVQISSIDPIDPAYNVTEKKNLVASSRILDSLGTEGIVMVKDHPWYIIP
jgi:SH3-like domain-containing protein